MTLAEAIAKAVSQFKDFQYKESNASNPPSPPEIARYIDHTLLKPYATKEDIRKLCDQAIEHNVKAACVNSYWIPYCSEVFTGMVPQSGLPTVPIAVVGFPLGASLTAAKVAEARLAIEAGAEEIDMVINIGQLRDEAWAWVKEDIEQVYLSCGKIPLKVILETSMLTKEDIIAACVICREVGVAFVKTSTGFGGGGAKAEDVALMKAVAGDGMQVKASGGINSYEDAVRMLNAGATRIGTSSTVAIVTAGNVNVSATK